MEDEKLHQTILRRSLNQLDDKINKLIAARNRVARLLAAPPTLIQNEENNDENSH